MQVPDWIWIWPLIEFAVLVFLFFSVALIYTMLNMIRDIQEDLEKMEEKRQRKKRAAKKNV